MRVLLTGASGLIGKEAIAPLKNAGFEVYALNSRIYNLFDYKKIAEFVGQIKPSYLLHFAWITSGEYLQSPLNAKLTEASLNLLKEFYANGGRRAVMAGTCFEYDFGSEVLSENTALNPQSLYAKAKVELYHKVLEFCQTYGLSFAWGRIFYVYGHREHSSRLTAHIINSLKSGQSVNINHAGLVRDYMYSKDIAAAFVTLLQSSKNGAVNIGSGEGISLGKYALNIAQILNKEHLIKLKNEPTTQPKSIIADTSVLENEIGFKARYKSDEMIKIALKEILNE